MGALGSLTNQNRVFLTILTTTRESQRELYSISEKKWTKMENAENQWRLDLQSVLNETNQLTISASGTNLNLQLNQV